MTAPRLAQFAEATQFYANNWQATDETLYALCRKLPDHQSRLSINAKLSIIGRSYATGIERKIRTRHYQGSALETLGDHVWSCRHRLDSAMQSLRDVCEPLTIEGMSLILKVHGRVLTLIRPALRPRQTPRSFVSKYLHFHCPAVPIYDSVAERELKKLVRWERSLEVIRKPSSADEIYFRFSMRFWSLHELLRSEGAAVTAKLLDNFILWQERARR